MKGFRTSCSFSFPGLSCRKGRLRKAALRWTQGRSHLSRALHPSRRHLQLQAHRARRGGRHLQVEGLPDQRPRPAQDHDARRRRVHPPLSPARAARRLPPHSPLRPVCRNGSSAQHRARSPIAHRGHAAARERARRGRQRDRNTSDRPPMPMLRRPDDHHRYVRGRAPRAIAIADPDQDRHLMIIVALPASLCLSPSPPLARWSTNAMSSRPPQTLSSRCAHTRRSHPRPRKSAPCSLLTITPAALHPRRHMGDPSATPKSP
jgi:hypothetical protein